MSPRPMWMPWGRSGPRPIRPWLRPHGPMGSAPTAMCQACTIGRWTSRGGSSQIERERLPESPGSGMRARRKVPDADMSGGHLAARFRTMPRHQKRCWTGAFPPAAASPWCATTRRIPDGLVSPLLRFKDQRARWCAARCGSTRRRWSFARSTTGSQVCRQTTWAGAWSLHGFRPPDGSCNAG